VLLSRLRTGIAGRHWILALAAARCLVEGLMGIGVPVKLDRLGWSDLELGLVAALGAFLYTLACVAYSLMIHRMPLKRMMMASAALTVVLPLAIAATQARWLLFVLCPSFAFSSALFWPSLMAWIGDSSDEHLVGDMSAFNFAWAASATVGYLTGGAAEAWGRGASFYLVSATGAVLALAIPFAHIRGQRATAAPAPPAAPPAALPRRYAVAGSVAAFLTVLSIAMPGAIFVKLNSALGFGPRDYGLFWGVLGAAQAAVMLGMGAFQGWRLRRWPFVACLLASAAGGVLLSLAGPVRAAASLGATRALLMAGFACLGLGVGMGYALGFYYSVHGRRNRKRNAGLFEAVVASQSVVGGPVGGVLAMRLGRGFPYAAVAGVAAVAAVGQLALLPKKISRRARRERQEGTQSREERTGQ